MRLMMVVAFSFAAIGAAYADEACEAGVSTAIELEAWTASVGPGSFAPTVIDMRLKSNLEKGIRMLDASIFYSDILGRSISRYGLDPDTKAAAKASFDQQATYFSDERLLDANPDDIIITICTRQVVYDDGTVEKFE